MKASSTRLFIAVVFPLLSVAAGHGQNTRDSAASPLGLSRLKDTGKPDAAPSLASNKFSVDELAPGNSPGATKTTRDVADVLELAPGREWSRPLRGNANDVSFVSAQLYASANTIIEIGGARLGFTASPIDGSLQVMFDDSVTGMLQWKPLRLNVDTARFDGKALAMLPTLTVRLDPATDTWDIYSGSRLLADNMPMITSKKNQRHFLLRAGNEGAWLTGLVMADENPLYEDDNANGIDDRFEKEKRGALLPVQASVAERKILAQQWRDAQRKKAPALHVSRPMQDGAAALPPQK